jgi:hypothetical protein
MENLSQDSRSSGPDLNSGLAENEAEGVLTTHPRRSLFCTVNLNDLLTFKITIFIEFSSILLP